MRLRLGMALVSVALPLSYLGVTACSGDDDDTTVTHDAGLTDAATNDATTTSMMPDSATSEPDGDVTEDGSADAGPQTSIVVLNNLITVTSPIRVCFAASASATPGLSDAVDMMPFPTDGLAPGLVRYSSVPSLAGLNVRAFVYYTTSLSAFGLTGSTCADLFSKSGLSQAGTDGGAKDASTGGSVELVQTADFDVSPVIPASVFSSGARYLIMPTGCPQSSNLDAIQDPYACGVPEDGSAVPYIGDFNVNAYRLDPTVPSSGARVQGLNALQAIAYYVDQGYAAYYPHFQLGVVYADAGVEGDADTPVATYLNGPDQDGGYPGFDFGGPNGNLFTATSLPSLGGVVQAVNRIPPINRGDSVAPEAIAEVLQLSGITEADLQAAGAFTLVAAGDPGLTDFPDGAVNPLQGMRIILNAP